MLKLPANAKKWITLTTKVVGVFLLLAIIVFFSLRGYFLNKTIEKVQQKMLNNYSTVLLVEDAGFTGLAGISLKGIQLIPQGKDTLLKMDEFQLSVKLFYALFMDVRVKSISIHNGYFQLTKKNGVKNFDQFFQKKDLRIEIRNEPTRAASSFTFEK
jgi:hypothetical protein